jgi:dihydroneopterin aldolase
MLCEMKKSSLTKLTVSGIQYYAYHGVKPEERKLGGKYEVNLEVFYEAKFAILEDCIEHALNYEEVIFVVSEIMNSEYMLIETIANEILNSLIEKFSVIKKATVQIKKFSVPMRRIIDYVSAEQTIEREEGH